MGVKLTAYEKGVLDGAQGEALVSEESLVWSHGVDPSSGKIDDVRVAVHGMNVKDKVLVYPFGKGSTSGATWMLETTREPEATMCGAGSVSAWAVRTCSKCPVIKVTPCV